MIALLLGLAWAGTPPAASRVLEGALAEELARSRELRLPEASTPYLVVYDVLDGDVSSAFAEDGALQQTSTERYRQVRAEVRVGSYEFDSGNFRAFGEPDGVESRRLPVDDDPVALRREVWLATDLAYKYAVEQLARKQAARQGQTGEQPPDYTARPPSVREPGAHPHRTLSSAEVDALMVRLSGAASAQSGIEAAQAVGRDWHGWRLLLSTEGTRAWTPAGNTVVRVEATARRADGTEVTDARWWVGSDITHLPTPEAMEAEVRKMAAQLALTAAEPDPEPYLGPVLFEGEAPAELMSQLLAAEFAGTPPAEEDDDGPAQSARAPSARIGRRLLPLGWRAVDDPTTQTGVGGEYALDHEGVAPRRVDLVVDGVLADVLMSRTPSLARTESTGHGRGLGDDRRTAMPGNVTVTAPKPLSTKKLHALALRLARQVGHDRVLVIRRLKPTAMVQQLDVTFSGEGPPPGLTAPYEACFLDAKGVCTPTRNLRFVGVDRRALRDIAGAGPSMGPVNMLDGPPGPQRFTIGLTGGVTTTWTVPSLLISELELDPATGGEPRVITGVATP